MKWTEAIDLSVDDFRGITAKELKSRLRILNSVANRRLERLKTAGIETPASKYKKFSYKNLPLNKLKQEFTRVRNFLNLKSSTIKGAKAIEKELLKRLGADPRVDLKFEFDRKQFWEAYNKIGENDRVLTSKLQSAQTQEDIYNLMVLGKDVQEIVEALTSDKAYEARTEEEVDLFEILEDDF